MQLAVSHTPQWVFCFPLTYVLSLLTTAHQPVIKINLNQINCSIGLKMCAFVKFLLFGVYFIPHYGRGPLHARFSMQLYGICRTPSVSFNSLEESQFHLQRLEREEEVKYHNCEAAQPLLEAPQLLLSYKARQPLLKALGQKGEQIQDSGQEQSQLLNVVSFSKTSSSEMTWDP